MGYDELSKGTTIYVLYDLSKAVVEPMRIRSSYLKEIYAIDLFLWAQL